MVYTTRKLKETKKTSRKANAKELPTTITTRSRLDAEFELGSDPTSDPSFPASVGDISINADRGTDHTIFSTFGPGRTWGKWSTYDARHVVEWNDEFGIKYRNSDLNTIYQKVRQCTIKVRRGKEKILSY